MDLDNFETSAAAAAAADGGDNGNSVGSNSSGGGGAVNTHDMSLSNEDMNDVMKVLTGFDDYDVDTDAAVKNMDALTSVQDVSRVVDKAVLAEEKYAQAIARQRHLERRYADLMRKINKFRCFTFGDHVTDELVAVRSSCEKAAPPPTAAPPSTQHLRHQPSPALPAAATAPQPPMFKTSSTSPLSPTLRPLPPPPNLPHGVFFPTAPSPQIRLALPTTPLAPSSLHGVVKVKEEVDETPIPSLTLPRPSQPRERLTLDDKKRTDEVLGQLDAGLRHLTQSYDSDGTESSSGGESCDELDDVLGVSGAGSRLPFEDYDAGNRLPIRKRAKWRWLSTRSSVAARWTWLTAQISDLEYRIRQQTEFYRQIRIGKGPVSVQEPPPPSATSIQSPAASDVQPEPEVVTRIDDSGRRVVIRLPQAPIEPPDPNDYLGAARTRSINPVRKRQVYSTLNLHRKSVRAAKESSVRCNCIHPMFQCSICFGRTNHIQVPDPVSQEGGRIAALLDHSYHQVLSSRSDIPLDILMSHKLKNRDWLARATQPTSKLTKKMLDSSDGGAASSMAHMTTKERLEAKRNLKRKLKEERLEAKRLKKENKKRLKLMRPEKRRKSITVHHHPDGQTSTILDLTSEQSEGGSGGHFHPSMSLAEQLRRKRETSFDIDNIVIPYSMAASARVEKLKYKEILTPTWRIIEPTKSDATTPEEEKAANAEEPSSVESEAFNATDVEEELSDMAFEIRHSKAEVEERKRWQMPLHKSGRSRSRRQDSRAEASSGCNTPDPMSPCAGPAPATPADANESAVMMAGTSSAPSTSTRPSSPANNDDSNLSMSCLPANRYRRRTSSATKSRDRNPSESSRCTTPITAMMEPLMPGTSISVGMAEEVIILPYDPRSFPLDDEEFNAMIEDMPDGYDIETPEGDDVCCVSGNIRGGPRKAGGGGGGEDTGNRSSPAIPSSSRTSSLGDDDEGDEDETEDDPDWCADDPDDPEWTSRDESGVASGTSGGLGNPTSTTGASVSGQARRRSSVHRQ